MKRVNEFELYELAAKVHPLTEIQGSVKFSNVWVNWWFARDALNTIFVLRPLSVSREAAKKLYAAISEVLPEKWEDITFPPDLSAEEDIRPWQISAVKEAAKEFETVLAAECRVLDTYFVSKKGVYSTADLVENAHHHFPDAIRSDLPDQTKNDFDQAGKCIAFDLPTAAAFHLLRGTESVLRKYYEQVVPGEKKAAPKMRNWGVYIKLLHEHGAESKVTSLLTHLKDAYRNPVLHPEENYTEERIQVLFGVCVSAIVMMVEEMKILSLQTQQLPFSPDFASQLAEFAATVQTAPQITSAVTGNAVELGTKNTNG
jgi:hypothetical protein